MEEDELILEEPVGEIYEQEEMFSLEDMGPDDYTDKKAGNLAAFVMDRYHKAETARETEEIRFQKAYRNYRGLYGPDVQFTDTEKSRIFVKVTKTKVLAAAQQINDVLLGGNSFPIGIEPSRLPEGVMDSANIEIDPNAQKLLPGETDRQFKARLGSLRKKFENAKGMSEGPGSTPSKITILPALETAKKMQKAIHDQLDQSDARKQLRKVSFECALFGTGIMAGPFLEEKELANWDEAGNYTPVFKKSPRVEHVSIWDFFPDPDATTMDEAEFVVRRRKMSRGKLRALKKRPFFREEAIEKAIMHGPNYREEYYEQIMNDQQTDPVKERWEVLEYWGNVDRQTLLDYGFEEARSYDEDKELAVNVWVCHNTVLRVVINPFQPSRIPYHVVPYEVNPYNIFGIGLAENMDDSQTLMNGFMRMAVDNAALSGNLVFEIDEANLETDGDLTPYPGKVYRRQAGAPGQAIFGTQFPNTSAQNMQMFDKARVLADESTGFPSFAHGQTGVQGTGRTAAGISMLMNAANGGIKNVIKNFDDYLLGPLGRDLFHFNMQFNDDPEIKGDLKVKATGTESFMANEVRSQRLLQFLGIVQNPMMAPFAKMEYIIREIARSMELDPDKVTNNMAEAAVQAELLKAMNPEPAPGPGAPAEPEGGAPAGPGGGGGANIGVGQAPVPGEEGFTGAPAQ